MATSGKKAHGSELQYGDAAGTEKFTTVTENTVITPGEATSETADVTSHDSAADEFVNIGVVDEGEYDVEGIWSASTSQEAVRAKLGGAKGNWQLCTPNWGKRTKDFTTDFTTDLVSAATHLLTTGQPVRLTTSAADLPDPLVIDTTYYVIWVSADTLKLAATNALAVAGTPINLADDGAGTHTLQIGTRIDMAAVSTSYKILAERGDVIRHGFKFKVTGATAWS